MTIKAGNRVHDWADAQAAWESREDPSMNPSERAAELVREAEEAAEDAYTGHIPADMVEVPTTWHDGFTLADFLPDSTSADT